MGSLKVIFLSYCYRADKSTIFGTRGLCMGFTINSGRGATLKYLEDSRKMIKKKKKKKYLPFFFAEK